MEFFTVLLIAVGLAMDAFAVSITNGMATRGFSSKDAVRLGVYFGGFQFMMPILGWVLGRSVKQYIEAFDHWIAFLLLIVIGIGMIKEGIMESKECPVPNSPSPPQDALTRKKLIVQAVATSIDALAVGISFAILDIHILIAALIIGVVAFCFSYFGGMAGKKIGTIVQEKAQIFGGIVLIGIGVKILLEHTIFL